MRPAALQASGQPVALSDFVSERQFGCDPYTDELLRPLGLRHLLGVSLRLSARRILLFALHRRRGEGDFSPTERGILRLVAPDIAAAARHETFGVPQNESAILGSLESREREVAEGALRGLANCEIARELGLSERTVGYYFTKLYRKLGVPDRPRLVALVTGQLEKSPGRLALGSHAKDAPAVRAPDQDRTDRRAVRLEQRRAAPDRDRPFERGPVVHDERPVALNAHVLARQ
jgi:DNA-binding CsgD family transcriptional regulator